MTGSQAWPCELMILDGFQWQWPGTIDECSGFPYMDPGVMKPDSRQDYMMKCGFENENSIP